MEQKQHQVPAFSERLLELDIEYFRDKLTFTFDATERARLEKQIALLEDAAVIYHETRLGDN